MFREFKEFAVKGNAVDMAVGIIIGAAFGSIITSLVKDIIMPPISLLTGGLDWSNKFMILRDAPAAAFTRPRLMPLRPAPLPGITETSSPSL